MNELVEKLLAPVSAEQPCGPDLSDQPQFDELARLLKGKPEIDVGSVKKPAEPPDWRELRSKSAEYLAHSKHLGVALMFCGSALQTSGLTGLRDGLQLVRGLVEQYWPTIYPPLDVEENNDPTQRLNLLGALNSPRGTLRPDVQQWLAIIDYLYAAPLCRPKGAEPVTLEVAVNAHRRAESPSADQTSEGAPPAGMDVNQLGKAFRAASVAEIEANHAAVSESLETLTALDQFLTQVLGAGNTISFDELHKVLLELQNVLKTNLPGGAVDPGAAGETATGAGAVGGSGTQNAAAVNAISISGMVQSREDVVRAIDAICNYYRQVEPSSPVPYLLRRAQKVAMMNFLEAMQELQLASPDALRPSMGTAVDTDPLSS
jgi:type VI secretion system protein ImpA